jgi:hypothetical protein
MWKSEKSAYTDIGETENTSTENSVKGFNLLPYDFSQNLTKGLEYTTDTDTPDLNEYDEEFIRDWLGKENGILVYDDEDEDSWYGEDDDEYSWVSDDEDSGYCEDEVPDSWIDEISHSRGFKHVPDLSLSSSIQSSATHKAVQNTVDELCYTEEAESNEPKNSGKSLNIPNISSSILNEEIPMVSKQNNLIQEISYGTTRRWNVVTSGSNVKSFLYQELV